MINQYIEQEKYGKENTHTYIAIEFKKTIIIIEKSNFLLQLLLSFNPNINICFLSKIDDININNKLRIIDNIEYFETEIKSFNDTLLLSDSSDALKKQNGTNNEIYKLIEREIENYSKIQHPLMPKFIGVGQNKEYLITECINGRTLLSIDEIELNFSEKITIFFELMIIIEFLHRKGFIYRDLKPNNIMINENKTAVLIDFDRIIEKKNSFDTTTNDFSSPFLAPEVNGNNFSYECDIYSLGCVFLYIMNPKATFEESLNEISKSNKFKEIKEIISKSISEEVNERPSILEMIFKIYISYSKDIQISKLFEIYITNLSEYYKNDKTSENKTNQNLVITQFNLGLLYEEGELIPRDMNKSIHYFSLAANQNYSKAQFNLFQ